MDNDILVQLRLTEGTLFKNESVKRFFLDTKTLVTGLVSEYAETPDYSVKLESLLLWNPETQAEIVDRCEKAFPDMLTRLTSTCVTYAKSLYNKPGQDVNLLLKEPKFNVYLKSIFTRVASSPCFMNKSFFELDPINQDFVLRDLFRQALASDCIELKDEEYPSKIEEVYPCDSVSQIFFEPPPSYPHAQQQSTQQQSTPQQSTQQQSTQAQSTLPPTQSQTLPQSSNFHQLEEAVKQLDEEKSVVSSVCKVPVVRRIELTGEE
jgi:hypothetical protein